MKRMISLLLCCFLALGMCSGCTSDDQSKEPPVLKVLIDLAVSGDTDSLCSDIESFLNNHAAGCGTDYLVEVEALPTISEPDRRNPAIVRMHMELMEGGPDVFLVRNYTDSTGMYPDLKNLFPYPGSAMRQHLFLPLDEYIENDEDWEQMLPAVTAAGSLNGSQQLVPLGFGIKASLIDSEKYQATEPFPMTAHSMLTSDDPILRWAAVSDGASLLGAPANYETEKPAFSQEELLGLVRDIRTAQQNVDPMEIRELGGLSAVTISPINESLFHSEEVAKYTLLPAYNQDGGLTAWVESYAAINRNTEYPDQAYAILKSLFGAEGQRNDRLTSMKLPVRVEPGSERTPDSLNAWLDEWEYEQLAVLLEHINQVDFVTPLTGELEALFASCIYLEDDGQVETAVEDAYFRLRTMISES